MNIAVVALIVVLVILGGLVGFVVGIYNKLVTLKNRFKNAFSQIDVQLRRRYDLIPSLVETAKGYMAHEKDTLTAVTEARNVAASAAAALAKTPGDVSASAAFAKAETGLAGMLSRLMVVAERYPELKADQNMARLMEELSSTENRIAFARQAYNDSVTVYNTERELFPASIIAGIFNFEAAALLEAVTAEAQREAPQVKF